MCCFYFDGIFDAIYDTIIVTDYGVWQAIIYTVTPFLSFNNIFGTMINEM